LEKECRLPGVLSDSGDTPVSLLCELSGHLMPCTSCLNGKWVEEDVCAGQWPIWSICLSCSVLSCGLLIIITIIISLILYPR